MSTMAEPIRPPRLVVIGLDGATWDVIGPALESGKLPALRGLMDGGVWGKLNSTVPPYTTPAWASFATGRNPAGHGVYSWDVLRPNSYVNSLATRRHIAAPALWEVLDRQGMAAGVYGIPMTYPPVKLGRGYVVCCFDAPKIDPNMGEPGEVVAELQETVGDECLQAHLSGPVDGVFDLEDARRKTEAATRAALHLMRTRPTDLFAMDLMVTDVVGHYFHGQRQCWTPEGETVDDAVLWAYEQADASLGEMLDALGDEATVVVISDHGMGVGRFDVDLNFILSQAGLLARRSSGGGMGSRLRRSALTAARWARRTFVPDSLWSSIRRDGGAVDVARSMAASAEIDWSRTQAFSWSLGGVIRLNVQGREPQGVVAPEDVDSVRADVMAALRGLELEAVAGRPVAKALDSREVYGDVEMAGQAPDVLAFPNRDIGCDFSPPSLGHAGPGVKLSSEASPPRTGVHRSTGIFAARGPLVSAAGEIPDAHIADIAPTVLYMLGARIPDGMTGRVIESAVADEVQSQRRPEYSADAEWAPGEASEGLTEAEEELVKERLKDLGYFE